MSKTVYLSPSTQEKNVGYGNYGTEEIRMNEVADVVQKILTEHDITIYRNTPTMTVGSAVSDSNSKKPDIHVAIHSNANNGNTRGLVAFCHKFGGEGEKLTKAIYDELEPLTPTSDRGVKEGQNHYGIGKPMYETAKTNCPATLIEICFHDNKEDSEWIICNIEIIGIAIAKGVLKYLGIEYINKVDNIGVDEDMYYIKIGDKSDKVGIIQTFLQELGLYTLDIDNDYGKGTKLAVQQLQAKYKLEQTGNVDCNTLALIISEYKSIADKNKIELNVASDKLNKVKEFVSGM